MSSDGSPGFEFELQILLGTAVTPSTGLGSDDAVRLSAAKRTVDQNYLDIDGYIDGNLATNPVFICHQERREDEGFEALRLLHNYLASVYSFNETIRVLVNRHTDGEITLRGGDFTPASDGNTSYYGRKLSFLRGLRTDFQHGGFSCLTFERAGELGSFGGYHVVFDRDKFVNDSGLREPTRFLQHTNERERRHPLCFIGQFHQNTLQEFHDDVEKWFDEA